MNQGPRRSATREINTDVVRIMIELGDLAKEHEVNIEQPTPSLMEKFANRVREERLVERAVLVNYLVMNLPDTDEVREVLEAVHTGAHRRSAALATGSDEV